MTDSLGGLPAPVALWVGTAVDRIRLKTAYGVIHWRPDAVACEVIDPKTTILTGVEPSLSLSPLRLARTLRDMGVKTLLNCDNLPTPESRTNMMRAFDACLNKGIHAASGAHWKLRDQPEMHHHDQTLIHDIRHDQPSYVLGNGAPRSGYRILTVGPDGAVGKKYAALAVARELRRQKLPTTFCASGQTGRLLCGPDDRWIVMDTIAVDFATGAAEQLSPSTDDDHAYVIEGQANPWHPGWGPPSLGLLMGSRPDAIVYCAVPGRKILRTTANLPVPKLRHDVHRFIDLCSTLGYGTKLIGVAVNKSEAGDGDMDAWMSEYRDLLGHTHMNHHAPLFDPMETESAGLFEIGENVARTLAGIRRERSGGPLNAGLGGATNTLRLDSMTLGRG